MKKGNFIKFSEINLPLEELKLEDEELLAFKGGSERLDTGSNCHCSCTSTTDAGNGNNCNCTCGIGPVKI